MAATRSQVPVSVLSTALLTLLLLASAAHADKKEINQSLFGGVAIEGYDPVAYFDVGKAVKGSKEHELEWRGATWRFSSAERLERFRQDPEAHAPQYGGYCAWAVSRGGTAGIDPEAFTLHDGKLYLNYSLEIQERWRADKEALIEVADRNWPSVLE